MKKAGRALNTNLCPHFAMSRTDLFGVIKIKGLRAFSEVMQEVGISKDSVGCELCKPAIGSILSSLYALGFCRCWDLFAHLSSIKGTTNTSWIPSITKIKTLMIGSSQTFNATARSA